MGQLEPKPWAVRAVIWCSQALVVLVIAGVVAAIVQHEWAYSTEKARLDAEERQATREWNAAVKALRDEMAHQRWVNQEIARINLEHKQGRNAR